MKASPDTRNELGVAVWGARPVDEDTAQFTGYDANGQAVVTIARRDIVTDTTHHFMEIEMSGRLAQGRLRMDGVVAAADVENNVDITLEVTENTVSDSPRAQAVLDRMGADFSANVTADAPTSLVETSGDLLGKQCVQLLTECGKNLVGYGKDILPCAKVLKNAKLVIRCGIAGAALGGVVTAPTGPGAIAGAAGGAALGAGLCGWLVGRSTARNAEQCYENVKKLYESWDDRKKETAKACGDFTSCKGK